MYNPDTRMLAADFRSFDVGLDLEYMGPGGICLGGTHLLGGENA